MSYHPVGDWRSDLRETGVRVGKAVLGTELADAIGGAAGAMGYLVQDPALPEVAGLITDIYKHTPVAVDGSGTRSALRPLVKPLKLYAYTVKNPWAKWAVVAAILGIPFLLGRSMGRSR